MVSHVLTLADCLLFLCPCLLFFAFRTNKFSFGPNPKSDLVQICEWANTGTHFSYVCVQWKRHTLVTRL